MNRLHVFVLYAGIMILSIALMVQADRIGKLEKLTNIVWNDVLDVRQYAISIANDRSR